MWPCKTMGSGLILALLVLGAVAAPHAGAQCQIAKLTAPDGAPGDRFGYSLGLSLDAVVVAAPWNDELGYNRGAAYVYERSGASWALVVKLLPEAGVGFGRAVALDEHHVVVGAAGAPPSVFERSGDSWLKVAELIRDDYEPGEQIEYGYALALSAHVAVVGAPRDNEHGSDSGSAYVFERGGDGTWSQVAELTADDGDSYDRFGDAVAIDGDVIVVGAPDDEDLGNWSGSAYVFERDQDRTWSQVAKLLASDGGGFDSFGESVGVSEDLAVIGASRADGQVPFAGAAYVFKRNADGVWAQTAKLAAHDGENSESFGFSVAVSGQVAVIGARWDDPVGFDSGSAYVFAGAQDGIWSQVGKLWPEDGAAEDRFGSCVAMTGNIAVIGAYQDDDHGQDSGSAYVFAVGPDEDEDGVMDACECPGDLNHDWIVDFLDALVLLEDWGCTGGDCPGDCDNDGDTDQADLGLLLANWSNICP